MGPVFMDGLRERQRRGGAEKGGMSCKKKNEFSKENNSHLTLDVAPVLQRIPLRQIKFAV